MWLRNFDPGRTDILALKWAMQEEVQSVRPFYKSDALGGVERLRSLSASNWGLSISKVPKEVFTLLDVRTCRGMMKIAEPRWLGSKWTLPFGGWLIRKQSTLEIHHRRVMF